MHAQPQLLYLYVPHLFIVHCKIELRIGHVTIQNTLRNITTGEFLGTVYVAKCTWKWYGNLKLVNRLRLYIKAIDL